MPRDVQITVPRFRRVDEYAGPWMIEPLAARTLLDLAARTDLAAHVAQAEPEPVQSLIDLVPLPPGPTGQARNIAVIRLGGLLMKQVSSMTAGTSTVQARRDVRAAAADPAVAAILLVIDSPGGTASGTSDLADDVRAAAGKKPTWAFVEDLCASAAYFVASQCDRIDANSAGALVGSIGTVLALYDRSGEAKLAGVEAVVFATGPHKGAGTPGAPITADQRQVLDDLIARMQTTFDAAVMGGREMDAGQLARVRTGQVWPASQAIDLGLVDEVRSFDATIAALTAAVAKGPSPIPPARTAGSTTMTFTQWLASRGYTGDQVAGMDPDLKAALTLAFEAEGVGPRPVPAVPVQAVPPTPTPVQAQREAMAAEMERISAIQTAAARHPKCGPAIAAKAVREGWTPEKAELEMLRGSYSGNDVTPAGTIAGQAPLVLTPGGVQQDALTLEAAVCLAAGMGTDRVARQVPAAERERVMNVATSRPFQGFGLHSLMSAVIRMAGHHYHGAYKSDEFLLAAKQASAVLGGAGALQSAGFSTVSLPGILGNVANKVLLDVYDAVEVVWSAFCAVRPLSDFKPTASYRLDTTGSMKKVGPTGELQSVSLTEGQYQNQLDTYGLKLVLSRQMLINDDLGAFLQLPRLLGRDCAIRLEEAVFVLLLANTGNFFHAGNRNLISGASSALSIEGLTLGEKQFGNQVNSNGKPILVSPSRILTGTGLAVTAANLHKETRIEIAGTADRTVTANNPHAGKFSPYKSPYVDNTNIKDQNGAAISGQSATAWFLFADPAARAAMCVGFLNGQQTPTMREGETPMGSLGYQWDLYHDFGVAFEDPSCAVKSAGA